RFSHCRDHARSPLFQLCVDRFVAQKPQSRKPRSHRQWIPRKRSGLIDRACRRHMIHNVGASSESAYGESSAYNLSETRHIGSYPEEVLRRPTRAPEAGHPLVEYEQSAGFCSQTAQALKKAVFRQHAAHIADYGSQYDAAYLISHLAKDGFNRREIIKRNG